MPIILPTPPVRYDQRDQAEVRRTIEHALATVELGAGGGGGGGGGGVDAYTKAETDILLADKQDTLERSTFTLDANALPEGQVANFTASLMHVGVCTRVQTNRPCRLRIYADENKRTQDVARPAGFDPPAALCLLDILTTAGVQTLDLAPAAILARTGSLFYCSLQALDVGSNDYTASLSIIPLEA